MDVAYLFEFYLMKALSIVAAVIAIMALVDAVRRPAANFQREGKRTKPFWMAMTGAAVLVSASPRFPQPAGAASSSSSAPASLACTWPT